MIRKSILTTICFILFSSTLFAFETDLVYVDQIEELFGGCFLQGIKLEQTSAVGLVEPAYQGDPLYGSLPLAGSTFTVVIDRSADDVLLYADKDRSGRLDIIPWERRMEDGRYLASASFQTVYEDGSTAPYRLNLLWHPLYPIVLTYCRGGYREGEIFLNDTSHLIAVIDEDSDGYYDNFDGGILLIDVDQNSQFLIAADSHELFTLDEPFNIGGVVYEVITLAPNGSRILIRESELWVPKKLPLEMGFPAPPFEGVDRDEEEISLASLQGRIVLLNFWAGWCHSCLAVLPTINAIATAYQTDGVVVIGINLDRSRSAFEDAVDEYQLAYPQIYDGREGPISALYRIFGIPMTYLIDREGDIYAKQLVGEELVQAVEDLLGP